MFHLASQLHVIERGEPAMSNAVRLNGHFPALQLFQIIPTTHRLLRLQAGIEVICRSDKVGRHKKHRREPEGAQYRKRNVTHGKISIIERQQHRALWQADRILQAAQKRLAINYMPPVLLKQMQKALKDRLRNIKPGARASRRRCANLVEAQHRQSGQGLRRTGFAVIAQRARSSTLASTFLASKNSSASWRASRHCSS